MSEEILKALMELFALIVKKERGIIVKEREYLSAFLIKQLTSETFQEYLALFDEHAGPIMQRSVLSEPSAPSVKDSVKICLLYTSDAADEEDSVDLGGRRII